MKKHLYLLSLIFNFSYYAHAGIRVVVGGGGYAEMQAIRINQDLQQLLVGVQDSRAQELAAMPLRLTISEDCNPVLIRKTGANQAEISSCALYNTSASSSEPKSFREIASWVLAARAVYSGDDIANALEFAKAIFANFNQREQATSINLTGGDFVFHILQVSHDVQSTAIYSIEGKNKTVALPSNTVESLLCPAEPLGSVDFSSLKGTSLNDADGVIQIETQWMCGTSSAVKRAELQIYFQSQNEEVSEFSIHARLVGKH